MLSKDCLQAMKNKLKQLYGYEGGILGYGVGPNCVYIYIAKAKAKASPFTSNLLKEIYYGETKVDVTIIEVGEIYPYRSNLINEL